MSVGPLVVEGLPLLGFGLPVAGSWATPETMARIAARAESLGYASLWTFQRLLVPSEAGDDPEVGVGRDERDGANPGTHPIDHPVYQAVHDPVVPLAFVAAHTTRIGLGTATVCAPFIPPVVLAKTMASLDHLCAGRLTVGLGMGWLPPEYVAAGVPMNRRGARMEEYLRCVKAVWTQEPVQFAGEFYVVPSSHIGPAPVQRPHPPVLLGGSAPAALRRAGRLADGWIASTRADLGRISESIEQVRLGAREAGRDPGRVRIVVRVVIDHSGRGDAHRPLHGTPEQVLADLRELRRQGVTEVFVDPNFGPGVVSARVDDVSATAAAAELLETFAPAHLYV